jgi:TonB-dependent SusC/RagA subfamily outer membrane receptor
MRRFHRTLAGLSLLATAACAADSVVGPRAAPAPGAAAEAARGPIIIRGSKTVDVSNGPVYIIDGVVQAQSPTHLMARDITHIRVMKGAPAVARFGSRGAPGVVIITTRGAPVKALSGNDTR